MMTNGALNIRHLHIQAPRYIIVGLMLGSNIEQQQNEFERTTTCVQHGAVLSISNVLACYVQSQMPRKICYVHVIRDGYLVFFDWPAFPIQTGVYIPVALNKPLIL